jgi:hypothetical protein
VNRAEMLEQLDILTKSAKETDDAARDYENSGTRESLERVETFAKMVTDAAGELQAWHN